MFTPSTGPDICAIQPNFGWFVASEWQLVSFHRIVLVLDENASRSGINREGRWVTGFEFLCQEFPAEPRMVSRPIPLGHNFSAPALWSTINLWFSVLRAVWKPSLVWCDSSSNSPKCSRISCVGKTPWLISLRGGPVQIWPFCMILHRRCKAATSCNCWRSNISTYPHIIRICPCDVASAYPVEYTLLKGSLRLL